MPSSPNFDLDPHENDDNYSWFNNRNAYDLNSKIMLTAIISLSVVVVVVIALHLYARCVLRRQARRRAALLQLGLTIAHARSGEQPNRGLDPAVIASLPVFVFKGEDDATATSTTECAVCLSMIENEEMARLLPNCKHVFHAECVDKWLGSHSTCPICRTEAQPLVRPEPREAPAGPTGGTAPTAPPQMFSGLSSMEGTSAGATQSSEKVSGSSLRLNSFRRILTGERSSTRVHSRDEDDVIQDLERQ